jgi:hypothetical protein
MEIKMTLNLVKTTQRAAFALSLSFAALSPLLLASPARAELPGPDQPDARGLAIAQKSDAMNLGFGNTRTEMEMILTNANGDVSERRLGFNTLENKNPKDGDWSMMIFNEPSDVAGTAMLTYAHILDPDEQWMFLPALKRVKRISSVNK